MDAKDVIKRLSTAARVNKLLAEYLADRESDFAFGELVPDDAVVVHVPVIPVISVMFVSEVEN